MCVSYVCFWAFGAHIGGELWLVWHTPVRHTAENRKEKLIGTLVTRHNSWLITKVPIINRLVDIISGIIKDLQLFHIVHKRLHTLFFTHSFVSATRKTNKQTKKLNEEENILYFIIYN